MKRTALVPISSRQAERTWRLVWVTATDASMPGTWWTVAYRVPSAALHLHDAGAAAEGGHRLICARAACDAGSAIRSPRKGEVAVMRPFSRAARRGGRPGWRRSGRLKAKTSVERRRRPRCARRPIFRRERRGDEGQLILRLRHVALAVIDGDGDAVGRDHEDEDDGQERNGAAQQRLAGKELAVAGRGDQADVPVHLRPPCGARGLRATPGRGPLGTRGIGGGGLGAERLRHGPRSGRRDTSVASALGRRLCPLVRAPWAGGCLGRAHGLVLVRRGRASTAEREERSDGRAPGAAWDSGGRSKLRGRAPGSGARVPACCGSRLPWRHSGACAGDLGGRAHGRRGHCALPAIALVRRVSIVPPMCVRAHAV